MQALPITRLFSSAAQTFKYQVRVNKPVHVGELYHGFNQIIACMFADRAALFRKANAYGGGFDTRLEEQSIHEVETLIKERRGRRLISNHPEIICTNSLDGQRLFTITPKDSKSLEQGFVIPKIPYGEREESAFSVQSTGPLRFVVPQKKVFDGSLQASIAFAGINTSTMPTILGMRQIDFSGRDVIDLGCADGGLTMVAAKAGADRVLGVESNIAYEPYFEQNMKANGLNPQSLFFIRHHLNAENSHVVFQYLPEREKVKIALANIGQFYNLTDLTSIILLTRFFPALEHIVVGGYARDAVDIWHFPVVCSFAALAGLQQVQIIENANQPGEKHNFFSAVFSKAPLT